jgi:hypothetical protein
LASLTRSGRLGIGTNDPTNMLHVNGNLGIRQNRLYLSGGRTDWSSLSFNAHHTDDNLDWVFPDPGKPAVTIEMDTAEAGGAPRCEVWSTPAGDNTTWRSRLKVFGHTGNIGMAEFEGNVGIGTYSPATKLDVRGEIAFAGGRPVWAASGLRVVWGRVMSNGNKADGDGFDVTRSGAGRYLITFTPAFLAPPAVIACKVWRSFEAPDAANVDPKENAIVDQILAGSTIVATGDTAGALTDSNFSFLAIGPR